MSFIDNEIFDNIVVGEYRDNDGNIIKGAYTTKDDGAVLVGLNTFEDILYKSGVATQLTIEEAEKIYGEEIINREIARRKAKKKAKKEAELKTALESGEPVMFTQSGNVSDSKPEKKPIKSEVATEDGYKEALKLYGDRIRKEYKEELDQQRPAESTTSGVADKDIKEVRRANLETANNIRQSQVDRDKALVIKLIANGLQLDEIIEKTGFSRSKVYSVTKSINTSLKTIKSKYSGVALIEDIPDLEHDADYVKLSTDIKETFEKYKHSISDDVVKDRGDIVIFTSARKFDGGFCSMKALHRMLDNKKQIALKQQEEKRERHEKFMKEANESAEAHMQETDRKLAEMGLSRKQSVPKPEVTYDKDGDEIADFSNILNMFPDDRGSNPAPVPSVTEQPKTDDTDFYIQMMRDRTKAIRERESILPSKAIDYSQPDNNEDEWGEY